MNMQVNSLQKSNSILFAKVLYHEKFRGTLGLRKLFFGAHAPPQTPHSLPPRRQACACASAHQFIVLSFINIYKTSKFREE